MSTYEPIASQTLSTSAPSVTFSSIPQGYTDLIVVVSAICASGGTDVTSLQYNNDTTSGLYSSTRLVGNGSTVNSDRQTGANFIASGLINSTVRSADIYQIQNYSNGTTFKTCLVRAGVGDNQTRTTVGLWRNTNAITSLTISHASSINFSAGSTFSIYGIQVGQAAQKAQGGNIVVSDGTYMYHAFTSSGAFIPNAALTADVLIIAGGGGGGAGHGGGGGAGGYRLLTSQSLTATAKTVIVGAGGAGAATGGNTTGFSGVNSIFSSSTSTGGGGGGSRYAANGLSGGSGGGAGYQGSGGAGNAGSYSPVEGYAGGGGSGGTGGSGGGGAGAAGTTDTDGATGEVGGIGIAPGSTWASTTKTGVSGYYAGGGGGGANGAFDNGAGGSGGGGGGGYQSVGAAATTNTGSGGGGGYSGGGQSAGGNGGSGIVIIRYLL